MSVSYPRDGLAQIVELFDGFRFCFLFVTIGLAAIVLGRRTSGGGSFTVGRFGGSVLFSHGGGWGVMVRRVDCACEQLCVCGKGTRVFFHRRQTTIARGGDGQPQILLNPGCSKDRRLIEGVIMLHVDRRSFHIDLEVLVTCYCRTNGSKDN